MLSQVAFFEQNKSVKSYKIFGGSTEEKPKYTIAIPTYKRSKYLAEAIKSAINQSKYIDYEIIVVDNNPERNDETEQAMQAFQSVSNLVYYKNAENIGMAGNFNRLYQLARGSWVCMLHDDDLLLPNYLEKIESFINTKKRKVDALFVPFFQSNKEDLNKNKRYRIMRITPMDLFLVNCLCIVGNVIRKKLVVDLGGFDKNYYPSLDYHFWIKLSKFSNVYRVQGPALTMYRVDVNESCNPETLISMMEVDYKMRMTLVNNDFKFPKWWLRQFADHAKFQILFDACKMFNVNSISVDNYLTDAHAKTSWLSNLIFHITWIIVRILQRLRSVSAK